MVKYFKLQLDFKVEIKDYEPVGDIYDANERRIRVFLKEFLEYPDSVLDFYKESLFSLLNWSNNNFDDIEELLHVVKDEGNHFFPPAVTCPPDVRDFIYQLYSDLAPKDMHDNDKERYQEKILDRLGELKVINGDFFEVPDCDQPK